MKPKSSSSFYRHMYGFFFLFRLFVEHYVHCSLKSFRSFRSINPITESSLSFRFCTNAKDIFPIPLKYYIFLSCSLSLTRTRKFAAFTMCRFKALKCTGRDFCRREKLNQLSLKARWNNGKLTIEIISSPFRKIVLFRNELSHVASRLIKSTLPLHSEKAPVC